VNKTLYKYWSAFDIQRTVRRGIFL